MGAAQGQEKRTKFNAVKTERRVKKKIKVHIYVYIYPKKSLSECEQRKIEDRKDRRYKWDDKKTETRDLIELERGGDRKEHERRTESAGKVEQERQRQT